MISLATILLFFAYTWGLGFTVTHRAKKSANFMERQLINVGVGLGSFVLLSIILNMLGVPLDWKIFLTLSLAFPSYQLYRRIKRREWLQFNLKQQLKMKLTKQNLVIFAVIIIAAVSLFIYAKGTFSYPYLEDEDPWGHSEGMKYVALEKTAFDPILPATEEPQFDLFLSYIDPYPPSYDILMGVLHQTSPDARWTLKFFNVLIISLGFIFFFFFAQQLLNDRYKALAATIVLAALPSYLTHFIWATALAITLFFVAMYCLLKVQEDKKWWWIAVISIAAVWLSQNVSEPSKLTILILIYLVVYSIIYRKILWLEGTALLSGIMLSGLWFASLILRSGFEPVSKYYFGRYNAINELAINQTGIDTASSSSIFIVKIKNSLASIIGSVVDPGGSASRAYTFNDFYIVDNVNQINNPVGIGPVLVILILAALVYLLFKYRSSIVTVPRAYLTLTIFWLIYAFWSVNGVTFPVSIARGAFRSWILLAIPVSLLAAEGLFAVAHLNFIRSKLLRIGLVVIILTMVIFTSGYAKLALNTSIWPTSSAFESPQQAFEYGVWFDTIPVNTPVFMYTSRAKIVTGFGKYSCNWCYDEELFRKNILERNPQEVYSFLKGKNYQYLLLSFRNDIKFAAKKIGDENKAQELVSTKYNELIDSGLFIPAYQKEGAFVALKLV